MTLDYNKYHDKDGLFARTGTSFVQGKKVLLGHGAAKPEFRAETTTPGHDKHHRKHAEEMGKDFKKWKEDAADLLNKPLSKEFLDWRDESGDTFYRFVKGTHELVAGDKKGTINSCFILQKRLFKDYLPEIYLAELR